MKFANTRSPRGGASLQAPLKELLWVLRSTLKDPGCLHVLSSSGRPDSVKPGIHHHDGWELFCIIHGPMRFELAGLPAKSYPKGSVLIVPPECLHNGSGPQVKNLRVIVMEMPRSSGSCGSIEMGGSRHERYSSFSTEQFAKWTELLGETPGAVLDKIVQVAATDEFGRHHALGLMRMLIATYAEMCGFSQDRLDANELRVSQAMFFIGNNYFRAELSLPQVAETVGLSVSRLSGLFRQVAGTTVQQALIDIRLRRAMTLLGQFRYSIKEVAAMTGWSNQLYFSAAFRRRYGHPPSHFQKKTAT